MSTFLANAAMLVTFILPPITDYSRVHHGSIAVSCMIKIIFAAFLIALAHLIPRSLVYLAASSLFLL